jgi:hypothetical protein
MKFFSSTKENRNFYWDNDNFLWHYTGKAVGTPNYRFCNPTDEERQKYICHEKEIRITPNGVLVEYESNCFDIEDEIGRYNRDDDDIKYQDSELTGFTAKFSDESKRRHYTNKMFYNNNNELVFMQKDWEQFATLIGEELVHYCDSTVELTDKGISVTRKNIAKEFPCMQNMIGDFDYSGKEINVDNSQNEKEQEFFTYEELNANYKQTEARTKAYCKKLQEDADWEERNDERLSKFGYNNITLKSVHGQDVYHAYKDWQESRENIENIDF